MDAALALCGVLLLAGAMVIGVQAFDELSNLPGAEPTLDLTALLDGMAQHPERPEFWWVYATLFSTLIPSLTNLVIGAWALTRGVPWLARWLSTLMPAGRPPTLYDLPIIAGLLTAQWLAGFVLALGGTVLVAYGVWTLFPRIGHDFLDFARFVADLDIPRHLGA